MLYFVRHGQSQANLKRVFAGAKENSPLTELGREQAEETGLVIRNKISVIDRIISSPLERTLETAKIIAEIIGFDSNNIEIDSRLIEYDMGSLTGTSNESISSEILFGVEDAQNPEDFKNIILSFFQEYSNSESNILIVSHAGVGRMLQVIKEKGESKLFYDFPPYANASVNIIDWI